MTQLPVVFGLLSSLAFGLGDFLGGLATRRAAALQVTFVSSCAGIVPMAAWVLFHPASMTKAELWAGILAGLCGAGGFLFFYAALGHGTMGILAPLTGLVTALIPLAVGLLHGDRLRAAQSIGIALALVAVVLISAGGELQAPGKARRDVLEALAGGTLFGISMVLLGLARPQAGLGPSLAAGCSSALSLFVVLVLARAPLRLPKEALALSVLTGFFTLGGLVFFLLACAAGPLSIAATLSSFSPATVVLCSRIFLAERMHWRQVVGVLAALIAVGCIAS